MAVKVKLKINRVQWEVLSQLMQNATVMCPVEGWNLETYIIADLYVKRMAFWQIFPYKRDNKVKVCFSMIQAIAINNYFGATSEVYNHLIRIHIEPKLILDVHNLKEAI